MTFSLNFFAPGVPKPGGSKRGFVVATKAGKHRAVVTEDCKRNKDWRASVALAASEAMTAAGLAPSRGVALALDVLFIMPRPKSHYRTGKHAHELRQDAPKHHISKPDSTKLLRSTEDAMTGIVWHDDSAVAIQAVEKRYAWDGEQRPGAWVSVEVAS